MKTRMSLFLALLTLLSVAPLSALAMGPVDLEAELALHSKYVWRGIIATDEAVLQPGISGSIAGFGFGLWGNMDLTDANQTDKEFNEIDYSLTYGMSLPLVSFEAGLVYYDFPNLDAEATTELYLSAEASVILSPRVAVYQDIDAIKGAYWELGASHGVPLSPMADLVFDASLGLASKGYMNGYFGGIAGDLDGPAGLEDFTGASMSNFSLAAGLPYHPVPLVTVTPSVAYHTLLGDAGDAVDAVGGDKDTITFGLTGAFKF